MHAESRIQPQHREMLLDAFRNSGIGISTMTVNDYRHKWREEQAAARSPRVVAA